jgi:hypothetical protein
MVFHHGKIYFNMIKSYFTIVKYFYHGKINLFQHGKSYFTMVNNFFSRSAWASD